MALPTLLGVSIVEASGLTVSVPTGTVACVITLGVDCGTNGITVASMGLTGAETVTIATNVAQVGATYEPMIAVGWCDVSSTGTQTVTFTYSSGSAGQGPHCALWFFKDTPGTSWFLGSDGANVEASNTLSFSCTSSTDSIVGAHDFKYATVPGTPTGYTSQATQGPTLSRGSRLSTANSPGASTTSFTAPDPNYSSAAMFAVSGIGGGGGGGGGGPLTRGPVLSHLLHGRGLQ